MLIVDIIDYALSQSTLEQVFLKQIRPVPTEEDMRQSVDGNQKTSNTPTFLDYINGYSIWLIAIALPGLHQFYLGDIWRGLKYLFTVNECWVGWCLDLCEMHVLIQKRVEQYGHSQTCCCCACCAKNTATTAPSASKSVGYSTNSYGKSAHALTTPSNSNSKQNTNALTGSLLAGSATTDSTNPVYDNKIDRNF